MLDFLSSLFCFSPSTSDNADDLIGETQSNTESQKCFLENIIHQTTSTSDAALLKDVLDNMTSERRSSFLQCFDTNLTKQGRKCSYMHYTQPSLVKDLEHILAQRCEHAHIHQKNIAELVNKEELLFIMILYLL
jgi:hypothetical protein